MVKKTDAPSGKELITGNILDALLIGYKDTQYGHLKPEPVVIPSGSLKLDSCVAIKTGATIRVGGPAEVGKTSQSLLFAANYMAAMPKSKTIYINAESKLPEELQGRTGMKFVWTGAEWQYGTVFILESNVFDTICDILVSLLKTAYEQGEHLCIIIDSIDMLTLLSNLEKKVADNRKPAGVNYITKELFRRISPQIRAFNALLILITQYSATFKIDQYEKSAPQMMEGNNTHAINHQCSYALYYRQRNKGDYILEDDEKQPDPSTNKILGIHAKIEIKKSSTDNTGYTIDVPIKKGRVGNCIWNEKEVADMVLAYELANKEKAWITFDKGILSEALAKGVEIKEKINGMPKFYAYFEEDPKAFKWVKDKVMEITSLRMKALSGDS
jgi:hypothetical protein